MMKLPPPNLHGDYRDSCVVCLRGTDTAIAFTGEAEWLQVGLTKLGVPDEQAATTVLTYFETERGTDPGMVLDGEHTIAVRVCAACVDAAEPDFPAPGLIAFGVPEISPMVRR